MDLILEKIISQRPDVDMILEIEKTPDTILFKLKRYWIIYWELHNLFKYKEWTSRPIYITYN